MRQTRADDALGHYQRAVALDPSLVAAHMKVGDLLRGKQAYGEAADAYAAATRVAPDNAEAFHYLGLCQALNGSPALALDGYAQAIALDPQRVETHFLAAELHRQMRDAESALGSYDRALELDPDHAKAHHGLALLYATHLDDAGRALERAEGAVSLDPSSARYLNTLALIYYRLDRMPDAERAIRAALDIEPDSAMYREGLERILEATD